MEGLEVGRSCSREDTVALEKTLIRVLSPGGPVRSGSCDFICFSPAPSQVGTISTPVVQMKKPSRG